MSLFVDEIINSLTTEPEKWKQGIYVGHIEQLANGKIILYSFGNGRISSIITVQIKGVEAQTTWWDRYRLEGAINRWYENISLQTLLQ